MDTPRKQKQKMLSKIFGQLSSLTENIEESIKLKSEMVNQFEEFPNKLEKYVNNYIQTERQIIFDAADVALRPFILPIEYQLAEANPNRKQRQQEMHIAEVQHQAMNEQLKSIEDKDAKAQAKLFEILDQVQNKLNLMRMEGCC